MSTQDATREARLKFIREIVEDRPPEETAVLYDKWAEKYEEDVSTADYKGPDVFVKHFSNYNVPKDARIIEIGCGTGLFGKKIYDAGYTNLEGLDGSSGMLEKAEKKGCYKKLHQAVIKGRVPLEKGGYDVAILFGVLASGHFAKEIILQLTEIVKIGGLIVKDYWSPDCKTGQEQPQTKKYLTELDEYIEKLLEDGTYIKRRGDRLISDDILFDVEPFCMDVFEVIKPIGEKEHFSLLNISEDFMKEAKDCKEIKLVYDNWGPNYDQDLEKYLYNAPETFARYFDGFNLPKNSKILDVGCGTGLLGKHLQKYGYTNLEGLDGSSGMLEQAKLKGCYKAVYEFLVEGPLPLPDDSYDIVVWLGCVSEKHIPMEILDYAIKIVKPGGYIAKDIVMTPTPEKTMFPEHLPFAEKFDRKIENLIKDGTLRRVGERILTDEIAFEVYTFNMEVLQVVKK